MSGQWHLLSGGLSGWWLIGNSEVEFGRSMGGEVSKKKMIVIAIGSRNFFGAERRFFRIAEFILTNRPDWRPVLLINSSLYRSAALVDWGRGVLDSLVNERSLCIVPDRPSHLLDFRGSALLFEAILGRQATHIVFRARPLAYIRAFLGRKSIFEVTSPDVADFLVRRLPLFLLKRCGVLRCVSSSVHGRLVLRLQERYGGVNPLPQNAISCASTPYYSRQASVLDSYAKQKIIVSASRFIPRKNVMRFAEALVKCLPSLPDWRAYVLGQGDEESEIRKLLRPFIDSGQVVVGYEPDIESILLRSKIFVSLIEPDNYPSQGVMEAMLYGNALLLSDQGSSYRFLDAKKSNGLLTDVDVNSVADAIRSLVKDDKALDHMGTSSQRHLSDAFSPEVFIDELLAEHVALAPRLQPLDS